MTDDPLRGYFSVLWRRWQFIAAMTVISAIAAGSVSLATKPLYEATATLALSPATLSVPISTQAPPYYVTVDSAHRLPIAFTPAFYVALIKGGELVDAAARQAQVSVSSNGNERSLIQVSARGDDPRVAAQAANAWAQAGAKAIQRVLLPQAGDVNAAQSQLDAAEQALVKFSIDNGLGEYDLARLRSNATLPSHKKLELAQLLRARDTAETVYMEFAAEFKRSTILASTIYKPTIIVPAREPIAPISPKPLQNVAFGVVLGLVVGILGAFVLENIPVRKIKAQPLDSS